MEVEVHDRELVVKSGAFVAVYYKAAAQPRLTLRHRTRTDDDELLAEAWKAATDKARTRVDSLGFGFGLAHYTTITNRYNSTCFAIASKRCCERLSEFEPRN
jgi:hypothetical protein